MLRIVSKIMMRLWLAVCQAQLTKQRADYFPRCKGKINCATRTMLASMFRIVVVTVKKIGVNLRGYLRLATVSLETLFTAICETNWVAKISVKEFDRQNLHSLAGVASPETFRNWFALQIARNTAIAKSFTRWFIPTPEEFPSQRLFNFAFGTNSGRNFVKHVTSLEGCMNSSPTSIQSAFRAALF